MFNSKRIAELEARIAELEKSWTVSVWSEQTRCVHYGLGYFRDTNIHHVPMDEVVELVVKHLGLAYEPKKETTSGPALVKKERTRRG